MTGPGGQHASRRTAAARYVDIQHHTEHGDLATRLRGVLAAILGDEADPDVTVLDSNTANGMSSDTVLFDATWTDDGARRTQGFVMRTAPDGSDVPVFPRYDLTLQYQTMVEVRAATEVPVPELWWNVEDPEVLGRPFFVMSRVDGQVPPDVLPYTFGDNWVFDGTGAQRQGMQDAMVDVLTRLHEIDDAPHRFAGLDLPTSGATALARHLADVGAWYRWTLATNPPSALIESALDRLDETLPTDPGETVLSWGDARIGNVVFDAFLPVGVLDWEMAVLGPRELDLVWLTYSHRVFQDLAVGLGAPGIPDFLRIDDVVGAYEDRTGHTVQDLEWHLLFAATRWAIVFLRTGARQAAVEGSPLPENGDDLLHNRPSLEQLLAGTSIH